MSLYLVGTPIGNLGDISLRAIETLKSVDMIACEDTRHSIKLLTHFDIKKPLLACHKFNEQESVETISRLLDENKKVALITDAGMPCISDPGAIIVNKLFERGYKIEVVPGPTALTSAVALCGLLYPVFTFIGFLPAKNKEREELLLPFKNVKTNLAFYSSPYDINKDLEYLYSVFSDRKVCIIKEITKMHESVEKMTLKNAKIDNPKGEYVVIIEAEDAKKEKPLGTIKEQLTSLINAGMDKKEAVKIVAKQNELPKDTVYKELLLIK